MRGPLGRPTPVAGIGSRIELDALAPVTTSAMYLRRWGREDRRTYRRDRRKAPGNLKTCVAAKANWLLQAAQAMADATEKDWRVCGSAGRARPRQRFIEEKVVAAYRRGLNTRYSILPICFLPDHHQSFENAFSAAVEPDRRAIKDSPMHANSPSGRPIASPESSKSFQTRLGAHRTRRLGAGGSRRFA